MSQRPSPPHSPPSPHSSQHTTRKFTRTYHNLSQAQPSASQGKQPARVVASGQDVVGSVVGEIVGRVERYVEIGRRAGVVAIDGTLAVLLEDGNLGLGDSKQQQPFQRKPTITCDVQPRSNVQLQGSIGFTKSQHPTKKSSFFLQAGGSSSKNVKKKSKLYLPNNIRKNDKSGQVSSLSIPSVGDRPKLTKVSSQAIDISKPQDSEQRRSYKLEQDSVIDAPQVQPLPGFGIRIQQDGQDRYIQFLRMSRSNGAKISEQYLPGGKHMKRKSQQSSANSFRISLEYLSQSIQGPALLPAIGRSLENKNGTMYTSKKSRQVVKNQGMVTVTQYAPVTNVCSYDKNDEKLTKKQRSKNRATQQSRVNQKQRRELAQLIQNQKKNSQILRDSLKLPGLPQKRSSTQPIIDQIWAKSKVKNDDIENKIKAFVASNAASATVRVRCIDKYDNVNASFQVKKPAQPLNQKKKANNYQ